MIKVCILTEYGPMIAEIYDEQAPNTAKHFLAYVDEGYYDGALFYRTARSRDNQPNDSIKIDVIEAGYYDEYDAHAVRELLVEGTPFDPSLARVGPRPQIMMEQTNFTGVKHVDGALSFGRVTPDTVDDCFFICVGDQPELDFGGKRNPDGLGFPAFGKVVEGMDIVNRIHNSNAVGQKLEPDIKIISIKRI